jgi:hypothetical protein
MRSTDFEIQIPEPEDFDSREVFAFVGLALYAASVLEAELINLAVGLRAGLQKRKLYREELEGWFGEHEAMTFGTLAKAIRKLTSLDDTTEHLVSKALKSRNRLVHAYFRDHAESFMSLSGRRQMLEELRTDIELYRDADRALTKIGGPLWRTLGLTDQFFDAEYESMKARAISRDDV